jgi:hypothetical protein
MKKKIFNSKYPIILATMNKGSTLNFSITAQKAGIFPSLSGYHYYYGPTQYQNKKPNIDIESFKTDLKKFNDATGSNNLNVSVELLDFLKDEYLELCSLNLFSHVEIIDETKFIARSDLHNNEKNLNRLEYCFSQTQSVGIHPIFKAITPDQWTLKSKRVHDFFTGALIKSDDAAGLIEKSSNRKSLIEEFKFLQEFSPEKVFVPIGGIYSSNQICEYINAGAEIVGVGSYFSVAEEFEISLETKQKIIESSSSNLKQFKNTGHQGLIFSEIKDDDMNHTKSLRLGVTTPKVGHINMGSVVDHITEIKPLKDLVEELVSDLNYNNDE